MREATIRIPDDEFDAVGLTPFLSTCRDAGVLDLTELACQSSGCLLVVTLEEPLPSDALEDLDRIEWWEQLSAGENPVYLCRLRLPNHEDAVTPVRDRDVSSGDVEVAADGLRVSLVGSQEGIAASIDEYESLGVHVALQRLGDYDGPRTALDALTERQRDIVRTAFEHGYFDVPRTATANDVAAELDLDPSTVTEHLQRAERNLVAALLGET